MDKSELLKKAYKECDDLKRLVLVNIDFGKKFIEDNLFDSARENFVEGIRLIDDFNKIIEDLKSKFEGNRLKWPNILCLKNLQVS